MTRVEFHPEARAEAVEAVAFYEERAPGLGSEYVRLVTRAAELLRDYPEIGRPFGSHLRRFLIPRFPFGLLYRIDRERILIVAVMHLRRRPGYWRERL